MDVFAVDKGRLLYKSFDGNQWQPGFDEWKDLGSGGALTWDSTLSVTSAVPGRFDVFGGTLENGVHVLHKYYDGKLTLT